jgi:hypothetical protein
MIETLDDIVEQLANKLGVYGAHRDREGDCRPPDKCCRLCWTSHMKARILQAVDVDRRLA